MGGTIIALLEVTEVSKRFGGLVALDDVSLEVLDSEILGIIGPNGAGKTTLFNVISGFFPLTTGRVIFKGEDITNLRGDQIAKRGIGRTFQATTLFMEETVFDNIFAGFYMHYKEPAWKAFLHTRGVSKEEQDIKQKVTDIIELMGLAPVQEQLAMNLPHGFQRILGVGMGLAIEPELLLLDEPVTGMTPAETMEMMGIIRKIRDKGITIVLVEHDMKAVMGLCDRITVLQYGKVIATGLPEEVRKNTEVTEAYLGK